MFNLLNASLYTDYLTNTPEGARTMGTRYFQRLAESLDYMLEQNYPIERAFTRLKDTFKMSLADMRKIARISKYSNRALNYLDFTYGPVKLKSYETNSTNSGEKK